MIGLIVKNNLCRDTLKDILSSFSPEDYIPTHSYEALLLSDSPLPESVGDIPVITLGQTVSGEFYHIHTPVRPQDLVRELQFALNRLNQRPTFENEHFIFRSGDRSLIRKEDETLILLTEKENDLLSALATSFPRPLDKETLLKQVWNYSPDAETHTLESHIYTLRQKIGPQADSLIQSTLTGYTLTAVLPK